MPVFSSLLHIEAISQSPWCLQSYTADITAQQIVPHHGKAGLFEYGSSSSHELHPVR